MRCLSVAIAVMIGAISSAATAQTTPFDLYEPILPEGLRQMTDEALAVAELIGRADLIVGVGPVRCGENSFGAGPFVSQDVEVNWAVSAHPESDWNLLWAAGPFDARLTPAALAAAFLKRKVGRDLGVLVIDGGVCPADERDAAAVRGAALLRDVGMARVVVVEARGRHPRPALTPPPPFLMGQLFTGRLAGSEFSPEPDLRVLGDPPPAYPGPGQLWIERRPPPPLPYAPSPPRVINQTNMMEQPQPFFVRRTWGYPLEL